MIKATKQTTSKILRKNICLKNNWKSLKSYLSLPTVPAATVSYKADSTIFAAVDALFYISSATDATAADVGSDSYAITVAVASTASRATAAAIAAATAAGVVCN